MEAIVALYRMPCIMTLRDIAVLSLLDDVNLAKEYLFACLQHNEHSYTLETLLWLHNID